MLEEEKGIVQAPEFPEDLNWINSEPLTMAKLKGKVVLIDIWDYTCINCIRSLPYVKAWHERYASHGFVVIGVHTPEFDFAREPDNVKAAVERLGITYPVVLDNDYEIWSLYANQYWPREYLIDAGGYLVYDHAGEGNYQQTELFIQRYLERINPGVSFPEPYLMPGPPESGGRCYPVTPEIYAGYERGKLGNREGYENDAVVSYQDAGDYADGIFYAHGPWLGLPQALQHARRDKSKQDYLALRYHALSVNVVLHLAEDEQPYAAVVTQDGLPVPPEDRGEDLRAGSSGETYALVDGPRMYRIIKNHAFGSHVLKIYSDSKSFTIYSFTFGSCKAVT